MSFYDWFFFETGRTPEGLFSFGHLASCTIALAIFLSLAVILGKKFKDDENKQWLTILGSGIAIVLVQVAKMLALYFVYKTSIKDVLIGNAPLYLCDMQIFIIPLAALIKGRFRGWCYDFVAIWGLLMGFFGNYFAGNIYGAHCVISFLAVNSLLNHCISAFAALFIFVCGLNKMEKRDIPFTVGILVVYMTVALIIDYVDNHNFMFFFQGDGTPFTLFQNLVNDIKPLYQLEIYILQCGYMVGFYFVYYWIKGLIKKRQNQKTVVEQPAK